MESLTSDYEKLQKVNCRLEKVIESLESEKRNLNAEVDHLHREAANRESVLRYYYSYLIFNLMYIGLELCLPIYTEAGTGPQKLTGENNDNDVDDLHQHTGCA